MKLKLISCIAILGILLTSCNGDEIDALDKRVDDIENRIGNEPMTITFTGKNGDDVDITATRTYRFESTDWDTGYIYDYGDGTYYFYIERFADVNWNEGASIQFYYDSNTDEVDAGSRYMDAYFSNASDDRYINAYFNSNVAENTVNITVNSFDPATAKISLTASASSTTAYSENEYSGKAMNLELTFKGRLTVFQN